MKGLQVFAVLLFIILQAACQSISSAIIETPKKPGDGIETASLDEVHMNIKIISELPATARGEEYKLSF